MRVRTFAGDLTRHPSGRDTEGHGHGQEKLPPFAGCSHGQEEVEPQELHREAKAPSRREPEARIMFVISIMIVL